MNRQIAIVAVAAVIGSAAYAAPAAKPNDAQIAHIVVTADTIDITAAKQAIDKSRNKDVLTFANEMVRDHTAVNDKATTLTQKLNVTPEDNPTSQSLTKAADAKHAELSKLSGPAFDKAYAANEVAYHKQVNSALQTTLIPDAQNAELKSLLQTGLKLFREHQTHAEQLAAQLK